MNKISGLAILVSFSLFNIKRSKRSFCDRFFLIIYRAFGPCVCLFLLHGYKYFLYLNAAAFYIIFSATKCSVSFVFSINISVNANMIRGSCVLLYREMGFCSNL